MIRNEAPKYKKDEEKTIFKIKTAAEKQRLRLERLMTDPVNEMLSQSNVISSETVADTVTTIQSSSQNGEKPHAKLNKVVVIPDLKESNGPRAPPEFIRNIWGSSAGVGSGDFHIYRGIRRREYARQKYDAFLKDKEAKDQQFEEKIHKNVEEAAAKTAKKRAKRLKKKERMKRKRQPKKQQEEDSGTDSDGGSDVSSEVEVNPPEDKPKDEGKDADQSDDKLNND